MRRPPEVMKVPSRLTKVDLDHDTVSSKATPSHESCVAMAKDATRLVKVLRSGDRVDAAAAVRSSGRLVGMYGRLRSAACGSRSLPGVAGRPDMTGWRLMGDAIVAGQFEREIIRVGKYQGRTTRVALVVTESSLEVGDVVLQFGNGQHWSPGLRHSFADGSRSRSIDLPGHVRFIQGVELVRGSVPPGTRAHVELWGQ